MHFLFSRLLGGAARKLPCFGLLLCLAATAEAQGRFCLGGDLQHLSVAERTACSARLAAVRSVAARFGAPADWHFVMVCGEEGWKAYAPFSRHTASELERASADTDLNERATYFREERLTGVEQAGVVGSAAGDVSVRAIAHEIAGIMLRTTDEAAIQARVDLWMRAAGEGGERAAPLLTASR